MRRSALSRPLLRIDRRGVRRRFEERFSAQRMASNYLEVYRSLAGTSQMDQGRIQFGRGSNIVALPRSIGADRHAN